MNGTVAEPKNNRNAEEEQVIHHVLNRLGRPRNLFRTVAKKVWADQYRVNVYCTDESRPLKTVTITDSFFVRLTGTDFVCEPTISRKYT